MTDRGADDRPTEGQKQQTSLLQEETAAADEIQVTGRAPFSRTPEADALLDRARSYWQVGEWEKLAALGWEDIDSHPDRAKIALLSAVGCFQLGDLARARFEGRRARDWGCAPRLLAQILLGGACNSLGRVAMLLDDDERAGRFFESSMRAVTPRSESPVGARSRHLHESARLGLLPDAARLMKLEIDDAKERISTAEGRALRKDLSVLSTRYEEVITRLRPKQPLAERLALMRVQQEALPERPLLLATHHKAGTNFLLSVFRQLAKRFDLQLWLKFYDPEPAHWDMGLHQHARLLEEAGRMDFAGLHMVRHPMGLIHSATLYHETCKEPWVDVPLDRFTGAVFRALSDRDTYGLIKSAERSAEEKRNLLEADPGPKGFDSGYAFGGRSYRQMLESFERFEDKLLFEMHAYSQGVIRDMVGFPRDARFFTAQLEDISHDPSMTTLAKAFRHLEFQGPAAAEALEIAADHCLWNIGWTKHSTTGVTESWRAFFVGEVMEAYRGLFGWPEKALGYDLPRDQ